MKTEPKVSVILTTYFENDGLKKAIDEVIAQSYRNIEIVVVDDSGERHAEEVVREYETIEYVAHLSNQGQIAGWNTGMSHTSGELIQFHDDDDYLLEGKIRKQVELLNQNPQIGSVYCGIVDDSGCELLPPEKNRGKVLEPILLHELYRCQTTTMLTRRRLLEAVFPLKTYPAATDIALQLELGTKTQFDYLNEPLVHRTFDPDGVGSSLKNRKTRLQLINEYSALYDEYPQIRRQVTKRSQRMLGKKYMDIGRGLLEENVWSPVAITCIARANYHTPGFRSGYMLRLFTSLFGRFGEKMCNRVFSHLQPIISGE
ncbi:glycosyltransferase family 2 protein [Salinigranum halophilum]|uniref:glycosyltransferase family 2 protein n=1 Tax=Salinigranum halophilum TaxID=2565931 RepID=UPI0010A93289|nr:glycosyltransferase family 2 protein [Salinigranum halophilum]